MSGRWPHHPLADRWPVGRARCVVAALGPLLLACCTVGPRYVRPDLAPPQAYKSQAPGLEATSISPEWWRLHGDPELDALVATATASNQTLIQAIAAVDQARAQARIAATFRLPTITANPTFTRQRSSASVRSPTNGSTNGSTTRSDSLLPIDLTYEIDVWGRVRREVETARAQASASADDAAMVRLTVQTDVAQFYYGLRLLDTQAAILAETAAAYREQVRVLDVQVRTGLVSRIVLSQAQAQLEATVGQERDTRRARDVQEHALAILCGQPAPLFSIPVRPAAAPVPPEVPAGLPAMLLTRRPDVAAAERLVAAANAQIGAAMAAFYPQFSLSSFVGFESANLQNLADWRSRVAALVPGLTLPIFDGGRRKATLASARAQHRQAVAAYLTQVLSAYADVEDALTDLHAYRDETQTLRRAVDASQEYQRAALVQYRIGLSDYLPVIDAERTLLGSQLALAQASTLHVTASVRLVKALGGGWDSTTSSITQR